MDAPAPSTNRGLSGGAIAGIVIAVLAVVAAAVTLIVLYAIPSNQNSGSISSSSSIPLIGMFYLKNRQNGHYLTACRCGGENSNTPLWVTSVVTDAQSSDLAAWGRWGLYQDEEGYYRLINFAVDNGNLLSVCQCGPPGWTATVHLPSNTQLGAGTQWTLESHADGGTFITNRANGRLLTACNCGNVGNLPQWIGSVHVEQGTPDDIWSRWDLEQIYQ